MELGRTETETDNHAALPLDESQRRVTSPAWEGIGPRKSGNTLWSRWASAEIQRLAKG